MNIILVFTKCCLKSTKFYLASTAILGAFHLMTQVDTSIILSFFQYLKKNKDRTMFVSTYVTKWKIPINVCTTNTYQSVSFLNSQGWEPLEIAKYSYFSKDTLSLYFRDSPKVFHWSPGVENVVFQKVQGIPGLFRI